MIEFQKASLKIAKKTVLRNINLSVRKGEFIYFAGPSGSGKTTLLRSMYFDLLPFEGNIDCMGSSSSKLTNRRIREYRRNIGIIPQSNILIPDLSIFNNIVFPLRAVGISHEEAANRAERVINEIEMSAKKDEFPLNLSSGEQKKTCIARALSFEPKLILADEPTDSLDPDTALIVFDLLKKINKLGTTVVTATHNYKIIKKFPGKIYYLKNGRIVKEIE